MSLEPAPLLDDTAVDEALAIACDADADESARVSAMHRLRGAPP